MGHFDASFLDKNGERNMLSKRVRQLLGALKEKFFIESVTETGDFTFRDGQYTFDQREIGEWKPFKAKTDYWGYPECYCWFHQTVTVPEAYNGKHVIYRVRPYTFQGWPNLTNPQLIFFVNGKCVQGGDRNHTYFTVDKAAKGGEVLDIYINAYADDWEFKGEMNFSATLEVVDDIAEDIYYDLATPFEVTYYFDCDDNRRVNLVNHLNEVCNILDIDSGDLESFHRSAAEAKEYLNKYVYGKYDEETAWCVGHTHIDVAWLWRLRQTRDKAGRSFATVLKYMEEFPDYHFMSPQAQLYDFVKQDYPEVYEGIKKKIKDGQWEAEGSMWVEADTNVASGEALIRQFLVGKRFFKNEFGVDNKIMWLPDVFGYSAALPQLIKKCDMDYFMTTKISWNEFNRFPFDTFKWKGIDGTEVLAHFSTGCDPTDNPRENYQTTYNTYLSPKQIIGGYRRYGQKDLGKDYLISYGYGDGGGGVTTTELEYSKRMTRGIEGCPVVKQAKSLDFFRHLDEQVSGNRKLPTWYGELYLEFHRGTLTSQARNKKFNRKSECLYHDVETFRVLANKKAGLAYPKEELLENWKLILLNQFHDILPGSSIKEVYEDSKVQYEQVLSNGCKMAAEGQAALIGKMNLKNNAIVVFNSTGFARKDAVVTAVPVEGEFAICNKNGAEVPYQITYDGKLTFIAEVGPKGYASYTVKNVSTAKFEAVAATEKKAETPYFDITFDDCGNIANLIHKQTGRSVAPDGKTLGKVRAFQDRPFNNEAWDIKCYFEEKSWDLDFVDAKLIENGPVRAVYQVNRTFRKSTFTEYYIVYNALDRIDVDYEADWHEDHVVLKAEYPVDVNAVKATFDIQFGNIERSTTRNTTWEFAQFEESMHKWIDLSDNSFGLSILNDCKYGCDIKEGLMRPTLFRCATSPNSVQDREHHAFTFSIYPHAGLANSTNLVNQAYNINYPLYAVYSEAHEGVLPDAYAFISCDKNNIVIETVKMAEDTDDIIVRAYETWNSKTPAKFTVAEALGEVSECNMLEEKDEAMVCTENGFEATFKPFEIKTFRLKLR